MNILRSHKTKIFLTLIVGIFFFLALVTTTQAQGPAAAAAGAHENEFYQFIFSLVRSIGAGIMWVGGSILELTLSALVVNMAGTMGVYGMKGALDGLWAIIRDLFNLLFIFGLLWVGFQLILGINDSQAKKTLVSIIVAALLINFSLYITQVIIDASNVAAHQIYELIQSEENDATFAGFEVKYIGSGFLQQTSVERLGEFQGDILDGAGFGGFLASLVAGLVVAFVLSLIGFVFAAGAFLMLMRFFYLFFIMLFSPVMFLGFVLPNFGSYAKQWWTKLLSQAFVGPAYIFMIYMSLQVVQSAQPGNITSFTAFLLYLFIMAGFAWAALIVAKNMGAVGATQAIKLGEGMGRGMRSMASSAAGATSGYVGRAAVGKYADKWEQAMEKRGVSERNLVRGFASKMAKTKFGSSYSAADARASTEKASQKRARYDELYGKRTGAGAGPGYFDGGTRQGGIVGAIQAGHSADTSTTEGREARTQMEKAVSGASNEQLVDLLGQFKKGSAEYEAIVQHMSANQFDALMKTKSEDLDDAAKADLATGRQQAVEATVIKAGTDKVRKDSPDSDIEVSREMAMQKGISTASDAQLKTLGVVKLLDNAAYLKQSQFDKIIDSKDYTETEKESLKKAREDQLWKIFEKTPQEVFTGKKDPEIAKLPDKILKDPYAAEYLTGGALKKIMDDGILSSADRKIIQKNIQNFGLNESANKFLKSPLGEYFI